MFALSNRTHLAVALRALAALSSNPDDLPQVFTIIQNLSGRTADRIIRRMRASKDGALLLATKPNLGTRLADRTALRALPAGTLGRAYADFGDREGITHEGIVDASTTGGNASKPSPDDDTRFVSERMRDTHDIWHVVTGYGTDLVGETSLLTFTFAQTKHPGIALVALLSLFKSWTTGMSCGPMMLEAYRRARRAGWLPAVEWEKLFDRPLAEVRDRLQIGPPPSYAPVTSAALREKGHLRRPDAKLSTRRPAETMTVR